MLLSIGLSLYLVAPKISAWFFKSCLRLKPTDLRKFCHPEYNSSGSVQCVFAFVHWVADRPGKCTFSFLQSKALKLMALDILRRPTRSIFFAKCFQQAAFLSQICIHWKSFQLGFKNILSAKPFLTHPLAGWRDSTARLLAMAELALLEVTSNPATL